jgi:predicted dehydrogenase
MRFALIGAGKTGSLYARIISEHEGWQLTAVVSNRLSSAEKLSALYGGTAYADGDVSKALKDQSVDIGILATPEWIRHDHIGAITKARKHLFYEKPLAASWSEGKKNHALLKSVEQDCLSMPAFTLRFTPQFVSAHEYLQAGGLQTIRHIYSRRNGNQIIARRISGKFSPFYWLSPHDIDLIRWLTGSEVSWVQSTLSEGTVEGTGGYIMAQLHMENGIDVQHLVSWCVPEISTTSNQTMFEIFGTAGVLELNEKQQFGKVFQGDNRIDTFDVSYAPVVDETLVGPFRQALEHFVRCVREQRQPSPNTNDALATVKVCAALELAAQRDQRVFVAELS